MRPRTIALAALLTPLWLTACGAHEAAHESNDGDDHVARMEVEHQADTPEPSPMAAEGTPGVESSEVSYARIGEEEVRGYLAVPADGETPRAAVLLIHEWWGLNDSIRAFADRFAGEGYLALAVDLYHGEVATDRDGASALMRASMEETETLADSIGQALAYLESEHAVEKVGVIGWCFGGGWSLETALAFPQAIDAAVIYYGRLVTDPARLSGLQSPILGIFGRLDQGIPIATVEEFETALAELDKEAEIRIYDEADHAFANPSGTRYSKADAEDAWGRTLDFFADHLGAPADG